MYLIADQYPVVVLLGVGMKTSVFFVLFFAVAKVSGEMKCFLTPVDFTVQWSSSDSYDQLERMLTEQIGTTVKAHFCPFKIVIGHDEHRLTATFVGRMYN